MDNFWEILKYTLPSLILFFTIFFVLKNYLKSLQTSKIMELQSILKKEMLPVRIQAYERLMLFMERINIEQLVYRIREPEMSVKHLQTALMVAVQQELEHNLSQQIYISGNLWKIIELAKNEVLNHIVNIADHYKNDEDGKEYSNALISNKQNVANVLDKAKEALRSEARLLF